MSKGKLLRCFKQRGSREWVQKTWSDLHARNGQPARMNRARLVN